VSVIRLRSTEYGFRVPDILMKKIRIGNQTAYSALTPMMPFEYAAANGFDAFEWFPDKKESGAGWDEKDIDAETRSYIKDKSQKHDIALSVHSSLRADLMRERMK
jgi:hypothetical protein